MSEKNYFIQSNGEPVNDIAFHEDGLPGVRHISVDDIHALEAEQKRLEWVFTNDVEFRQFRGGWQYGHMVYEDFIPDCDEGEYFTTFREAIDDATEKVK